MEFELPISTSTEAGDGRTLSATADGRGLTMVLCCMCGVPIVPNAANTCAACLASRADITKGISTEATLHQCRGCQRWHKEAGKWVACDLESRELMALCLANVSGLRGADKRLVDAGWIWTEPHSMRLKVQLTIQREVEAGTILQQSFVVIFLVRNQQCIECQAEFRQGSWKSLVQVRQRVSHKRTFLYLEQLVLKHGAHRGCLNIETFRDGMDFYFPDKSKSARFISFLENVCPVKVKMSKKLVGTDDKNNISNFKYTNFVEICPLCKDDLLYLPPKTAQKLGNISRLVIVKYVSNIIHLIDPLTGQQASMEPDVYWRDPIRPLISAARSRLSRYVVLGKEPFLLRPNTSKRAINRKQRNQLAVVTVAREDDLGKNDVQVEERSHIGYLLKAGDVCLGYDLKDTQLVNDEVEGLRTLGKISDVIVLRKLYGGAADGVEKPSTKRIWQLQRLEVDVAEASGGARGARNAEDADAMDEEDFMQEVEADREMRQNINLYKSEILRKTKDIVSLDEDKIEDDDDEDEDDQQIKLDELLEALALDDGPDTAAPAQAIDNEFEDELVVIEGEKAAKDGISYVPRGEARYIQNKDAAAAVMGSTMGPDFRNKLSSNTNQQQPQKER